jgi:glycosyltransferase involved in cell wall biosynthesis
MIAVDYWKKHGARLEPKLIAKSDLCFANSAYLADYCKQYNIKSYYIGQGCELDDFQKAHDSKKPKDMENINNKTIGYVGSLNGLRLDLTVIEAIALSFPNYSIVLVGPEDEIFKNSGLHQIKNIHFLGQKPVNELPAYVNTFDICLNPQILNEITIGNYPRKIDEYLSLGKPVVATATKTMEVFKDHVYLATTKEDYIKLIEIAIKENSSTLIAERLKFVSGHTWENSVAIMTNQISIFLGDKK